MAKSDGAAEFIDCISAEESYSLKNKSYSLKNKCPGYDTKQSDGEAPVMLELWGMLSTFSLPSLPDWLWPGGVTSDRVLSMGLIELSFS